MPPYERTLVSDSSDFDDIRFEVRRLCDKYGNEYWRGLEPDNYPTEFVQELTDQGWLGSLIPEEYGGGGLSLAGASVILEEISASGGNPSACHAQMYVMGTLLRHGSDDQKQHYLPQVADGRKRLQAFAVTEPAAGSETTAIRTRAERDGDGRAPPTFTERVPPAPFFFLERIEICVKNPPSRRAGRAPAPAADRARVLGVPAPLPQGPVLLGTRRADFFPRGGPGRVRRAKAPRGAVRRQGL